MKTLDWQGGKIEQYEDGRLLIHNPKGEAACWLSAREAPGFLKSIAGKYHAV